MTHFALGIIVGILIRDIKCKTTQIVSHIIEKKLTPQEEKAQFIESVSDEEAFSTSKTIGDLLEKFKNK